MCSQECGIGKFASFLVEGFKELCGNNGTIHVFAIIPKDHNKTQYIQYPGTPVVDVVVDANVSFPFILPPFLSL